MRDAAVIEDAAAALKATGTIDNVRIAERLLRLMRALKLEGRL
jgi:hypothetical protein